MDSLNALLTSIDTGQVIEKIAIPPADSVQTVLEARDSDAFSKRWMVAYRNVESQKRSRNPVDFEMVTKIRESAYLKAFARWPSSDLAAYISDDFGLIADAIILGFADQWINGLLTQYLNGIIPQSPELRQ